MKTTPKFICLAGVAAVLGSGVWFLFREYSGPARASQSSDAARGTDRASPGQPVEVNNPQTETAPIKSAVTSTQGSPSSPTSVNPGNPNQESWPIELERLRLAMNGDDTVEFAERVKMLRVIKTRLTNHEVDALYHYLQQPSKDSQDRVGENWLRNDMMDKLLVQETTPAGLANLFVGIYQDRHQDPVMRDYAIQHMSPVYDQANVQERASIQSALWDASGETSSSIGGTALLALLEVSQADPTIDRTRLADTAVRLAADDHGGELTRITAVQICGRLGVTQALPVIKSLSEQSPSMPIRIAATAALGDYATDAARSGSDEARGILTQIVASSEPRQAMAAQSALRRITRIQTASVAGQENKR